MYCKQSKNTLLALLCLLLTNCTITSTNSVVKLFNATIALGCIYVGLDCMRTAQRYNSSLNKHTFMGLASLYASGHMLNTTYSEKQPKCPTCTTCAAQKQENKTQVQS